MITEDADDPSRSLMLCVKNNLGPMPDGLAYRITESGPEWDSEPVRVTPNEALNAPRVGKVDDAKQFLTDALADGPRPSAEIDELAKEAGIAKRP